MKGISLDYLIVWTLRIGVSISVALLVTGFAIALYYGALTDSAYLLLSYGVFVLFATPIIRVGVSVLSFIKEKDWLYTLITVLVLTDIMVAIFVLPRFVV